jgi:hypothetical protein
MLDGSDQVGGAVNQHRCAWRKSKKKLKTAEEDRRGIEEGK